MTTGTALLNGKPIAFDNYSYTLALENGVLDISISGYIKNDDLGKWVKVATDQRLKLTDNHCPKAGSITVSGQSSTLKVDFAANKSVDVFLNGTLGAEFADCKEFISSSTVAIAGR